MIERLTRAVAAFLSDSPDNKNARGGRYFMEPIIGVADALDPLFDTFKAHIGAFHETPAEHFRRAFGGNAAPTRVVSWILPINPDTVSDNAKETALPSDSWSYTRWYGEMANEELRRVVERFFHDEGYRAVAPTIASWWERVEDGPTGLSSSWSERHAAYAAGLGTFSLSDGFITDAGIAHRCGSVITDAPLPVTERTADGIFDNCLYYYDGSCKACIRRCPVNAITEDGHSKAICGDYTCKIYQELETVHGFPASGCGLCQSKVPCARANPVKLKREKRSR